MQAERYASARQVLPYAAALLLVVALIAGVAASAMLATFKAGETPGIGATVDAMLEQMQAAVRAGGPAGLESEAVLGALRGAPHVGMRILVDGSGRIVDSNVQRSAGDNLSGLGTTYMERVLAALPPATLDPSQRLLLAVSDAVQAEGEHADVYRYTARLLVDGQGNPVGAVAVGYDRNTAAMPVLYGVLLAGSVLALLGYWVALPLWVFLDAAAHRERAWLWAALAVAGNLLGVITYVLMRRPARRACPACHAAIEDGWQFCPRCAGRVAEAALADWSS